MAITQPSLIGWQAVESSSDLQRIQSVLDNLGDEDLMLLLEQERAGHRNRYPRFGERVLGAPAQSTSLASWDFVLKGVRPLMVGGDLTVLQRRLGVSSAVMLGLGSILGTGIFVSFGLAAGIAGPSVVLAIVLASGVATLNALSSAQLAAAHPVSGGTYEYGYRYLSPGLGRLAGWLFLLAKSASAATAAIGFSSYAVLALGVNSGLRVPLAVLTVVSFTGIVLGGIRRTSAVNSIIVSVTLVSLLAFVGAGFWFRSEEASAENFAPFFWGEGLGDSGGNFFFATALMFVAFTGYGRLATLAEEVRDPRRTIPRAIIITLVVSAFLYVAVAAAGVASVGAKFLSEATRTSAAPLQAAAREMEVPWLGWLVTTGAAAAMLGVLLNLILGLSRVLLAMGRRGDMPASFARVDQAGTTPTVSVAVTGAVIAGLTLIGSVTFTWSLSAFTVLLYYAITNAAALAMPAEERLYPRWIPVAGLACCLGLALWVGISI